MATIAPGSAGSFTATTAEGRLLEALTYLASQEAIEAKNPSARIAVLASLSLDEKTFNGTYNLPAEQTIAGDGSLRIVAAPYLINSAVVPGSDSPTFKSTLPEAYALEVLMYVQFLERQPSKNPNNSNFVSGTYNSDAGIYQGSFSLPVNYSLADGGMIEFSAQEYLLT